MSNNRENFANQLNQVDPEIYQYIQYELKRQQNSLELIASENIASRAVLEAQGSILTNKYAEGYPGRRYYGGCEYVDEIEKLAINRAKSLFNAEFVNVQPHSGSQANQAVFMALLRPHDSILSLSLDCGGHLTHGSKVNLSGKWFNPIHYSLNNSDYLIDYDNALKLAEEHKPKLIITGYSAYPRKIDFAKFRQIADSVGAYLLVDMAHIAGLVAAGIYDNPLKYAHIVTTTTHKTLRGPRGGMILTNSSEISKQINSAVFPGIQGGPLMHVIAAKSVAFLEALKPEFKEYMQQVVLNAQTLAESLIARNYTVITGGTDSHLLLLDLRPQKLTGKLAEESLGRAGLTCNKNNIPFDSEKPNITSGLRLGTPAVTSRGLKQEEIHIVANLIADVLDSLAIHQDNNQDKEQIVSEKVINLCNKFPIY